jgi:hypothetical protein
MAPLLLEREREEPPREEEAMLDLRNIAVCALLGLGACTQHDLEVTRRVQARLASEGVTDQVKVTTERRVVVLEGVVADRTELNRVELAARNTPGIMGVDNRLVVQNPVNLTGAGGTERVPASPAGPSASAPRLRTTPAAAP